ncbi:hypothetical protein N752_26730 [Desulforamulus aquiferis]|nr:hypothetical protein N752_26730 [Desulforamulus aquiferis]
MNDIMSLAVLTGKDTIFELMELRKIVEVESAALAAQRRTEEDLKNMKHWLVQMKKDIAGGSLGDVADIKFHYALSDAAHNSLLNRLMNSISETMKKEMVTIREKMYLTLGTPQNLYEQHEVIFNNIQAGNIEGSRNAMFIHLDYAEKEFIKNMNISTNIKESN